LCCLALLGGAGCFGKSVVTTSVVKWHSEIDTDKYVKEGIYLPIFFLVLPITALVDNLVLNAIDFWSKDDPLAASLGPDVTPPQGQDQKPELASEGAVAPSGPALVLE
jgi:hypothetical protein